MQTKTGRPYLRQGPAAEYIGIAEATLENRRYLDKGPRFSKPSRNIVIYDPDELDRFAEERTQQSTSETPCPETRPARRAARKARQTPARRREMKLAKRETPGADAQLQVPSKAPCTALKWHACAVSKPGVARFARTPACLPAAVFVRRAA